MKKHFFSLRERGLFLLLLGLFLSFSSYAQDITVKGVVKDSKFGDPIIGASVLVKGTTNGTISMRPYRLHNKYLFGKRLG